MDDEVQVLGKAEILASFPFNNKLVAGCKVSEGKISRGEKLLLMRKDEEIGKIRAQSLKKQKQKVRVVKEGEEFGIIFTPQLDFQVGDVILSVRK
jgi:translation initiation factor IF-2